MRKIISLMILALAFWGCATFNQSYKLGTEEALNTNWDEGYRFGNWRNYIYKSDQKQWTEFSSLKRLIMYCKAVNEADREEDCY